MSVAVKSVVPELATWMLENSVCSVYHARTWYDSLV